jgi:NAD(P)-dependent dehydrogenase (short-subunit alcohol dehydrogenase family)
MQSVYASTACEKYTKLEVWALDLANYASVLAFGDRVRTSLPRLDAFVANAGMEIQEYRTAEDLEIHLTVNVVSTFLSALLSLPKLRATAQQYGGQASLVFAGSMYHIFGPDGEFNAGMSEDVDMFEVLSSSDPASTDIVWRYALSKLMAHHCFHGLVDAMQKGEWAGVAVSLVNPGWCGTELSRAKTAGLGEKVWFKLLGWTAEKGSKTYVHALMMGKEGHGRYLSGCTATRESEYVRSERGKRVQEKMWKDLMWRIARISPEAAKTV